MLKIEYTLRSALVPIHAYMCVGRKHLAKLQRRMVVKK
jgi:hypothetical protein